MTDMPNGAPASVAGVAKGAASAPSAGSEAEALETARSFVSAVAWGEHHRVWDLLAEEGRHTIFRVAVTRGMDEALVDRLRGGTAAPAENEEFLTDLVNGLRADLQGIDLDTLDFEADPTGPQQAGRTRVVITSRLPPPLAVMGGALPAGSVELSHERGAWRVERLVPRAGR